MNAKSNVQKEVRGFRPRLSNFFRNLFNRIGRLFEPEEVEVDLEVKGNTITYTYTEVPHKQVA